MINTPFVFFGSSRFSVIVLDELASAGLMPTHIVTTPDKPQGRHLVLTPTPVKEWAVARNIPVLAPEKLDDAFVSALAAARPTFALVASYGKIIPQKVLDVAPDRFLNIHPSLLPKYRGASPLQTAMLDDATQTGVTLMVMDAGMDHGPLIAQTEIDITKLPATSSAPAGEWPVYEDFEDIMARAGARLLIQNLDAWSTGTLTPRAQDHSLATFTKKITKTDALIDLAADPYRNFRAIQAFHEWPTAYFIVQKDGKPFRVKITAASYAKNAGQAGISGALVIEKVVPEGSKEMAYRDYVRGYGEPRS